LAPAQLAVIIPAWKPEFLVDALRSLANQRDRRFRVYVGDDHGDPRIASITREFADRMDLVYERFGARLGDKSLVWQWNRCVRLSSEPWVWLFSDDDVAGNECVARFYQALEHTHAHYAVYRFNTVRIDANGAVLLVNPPHPTSESSIEFLYHVLTNQRRSYAAEYIFSRSTFDRCGGIVQFPLAWCSDHATWASFGQETGIALIEGAHVRWRASGLNLTTKASSEFAEQKIEAVRSFCIWLRSFLAATGSDRQAAELPPAGIEEAMSAWAATQWRGWGRGCTATYLEGRVGAFGAAAGLPESALWSALSERAWAERAERYPYLAALPRVATLKWPRACGLADRLLRWIARAGWPRRMAP
jgi:hypothetical protein